MECLLLFYAVCVLRAFFSLRILKNAQAFPQITHPQRFTMDSDDYQFIFCCFQALMNLVSAPGDGSFMLERGFLLFINAYLPD